MSATFEPSREQWWTALLGERIDLQGRPVRILIGMADGPPVAALWGTLVGAVFDDDAGEVVLMLRENRIWLHEGATANWPKPMELSLLGQVQVREGPARLVIEPEPVQVNDDAEGGWSA